MTTYHVYENVGTLDIRAITMMGVNAKPNSDNPIGYFGTGLKIALAVLARYGLSVTINLGDGNVYYLQTGHFAFRDKDFQYVKLVHKYSMEVIELPYTTELGKDWELWMAMRELECNAMDEGGRYVAYEHDMPTVSTGIVQIAVSGAAYDAMVARDRPTVFIHAMNHNDVEVASALDVLVNRPSKYLYYRGVRVYEYGKTFAHTYNFKEHVELTEDRQVRYYWSVVSTLNDFWSKLASPSIIHALIGKRDALEWTFWEQTNSEYYNPETVRILEEAVQAGKYIGDKQALMLGDLAAKRAMERSYTMEQSESEMLEQAVDVATRAGFAVDDYNIRVVEHLRKNVLGMANMDTKEIIISRICFEHGFECVIGTLIEEYIHLFYNYYDETRHMQDLLLRRLVVTAIKNDKLSRKVEREHANTDG